MLSVEKKDTQAIIQQLQEQTPSWDQKIPLSTIKDKLTEGGCLVICSEYPSLNCVRLGFHFSQKKRIQDIAGPLSEKIGAEELQEAFRKQLLEDLNGLQISDDKVFGWHRGGWDPVKNKRRLGGLYPVDSKYFKRVLEALEAGIIKTIRIGSWARTGEIIHSFHLQFTY